MYIDSFSGDVSNAAYITESRKRRCLGCFDTAEAAHAAYIKAKRELHPFCTI